MSMGTRTRSFRLFELASLVVLLVFLLFVAVRSRDVSVPVALGVTKEHPILMLRRQEFSDPVNLHEKTLMGQGEGTMRVVFAKNGTVGITYGESYVKSSIASMESVHGNLHYTLKKENDTQQYLLCQPVTSNLASPVGLWEFVSKNEGEGEDTQWASSEWAIVNADGTGFVGWGSYDASELDESELVKQGKACTWRSIEADNGWLYVIDFDGGRMTLCVTLCG